MQHHVKCLFFGRRGLSLTVPLNYPSAEFLCSNIDHEILSEELEEVSSTLDVGVEESKICRLPNGLYVHVYGRHQTLKCSSFTLEESYKFFFFDNAVPKDLPDSNKVDTKPFFYSNRDLLKMDKDPALKKAVSETTAQQKGKYSWVVDKSFPFSWNESVWTTRLFHCIKGSDAYKNLEVIPAFQWGPNGYEEDISSLFPRVRALRITPFHGMSDILIKSKRIAVINVVDSPAICCIEVGESGPGFYRECGVRLSLLLAKFYYTTQCKGKQTSNHSVWDTGIHNLACIYSTARSISQHTFHCMLYTIS